MKLSIYIVLFIAFACAAPGEARLSTYKGEKRCTTNETNAQCVVCANELICSSGKCTNAVNEGTTRYRTRRSRHGAGRDAETRRIKTKSL